MPAIVMQRPAVAPQVPFTLQGKLNEALMSNLKSLDPSTLGKLHNGFYDAAASANVKYPTGMNTTPFSCTNPAQSLLTHFPIFKSSYFQPAMAETSQTEPANTARQDQTGSKPQAQARSHQAQSRGPGIFTSPAAEKAAAALRGQQTQTQTFLNNQLGQAYSRGDMSQFMASGGYFEDVLAAYLFKLADKDQRALMEQLRMYERNDTGLNGLMAKGANALGGGIGAAAGGLVGGALGSSSVGAAVGYDIGERIAGNVAGQPGASSKQVQYQKIQMSVQNMAQLMQMLSNVTHAFDSTNKAIISNMRG